MLQKLIYHFNFICKNQVSLVDLLRNALISLIQPSRCSGHRAELMRLYQ